MQSTVVVTKVTCPDTGGVLAVETGWGEGGGYVYALTQCCQAAGKGSAPGVVCRAGYRPVEPGFGGGCSLAEAEEWYGPEVAEALRVALAEEEA